MELKKLSYTVKNRLLLGGMAIVCLLIYFLPVSKTLEAYSESRELKTKLLVAADAPQEISKLKKQLAGYEKIIQTFKTDTLKQEEFILNQVSAACQKHGVALVAFDPPEKYLNNNYRINNRIVRIRGPYKKIVKVIYDLEHVYSVGRLASIRFLLQEDQWKRTSSLFAYLYIQNIQPFKDETDTTDL